MTPMTAAPVEGPGLKPEHTLKVPLGYSRILTPGNADFNSDLYGLYSVFFDGFMSIYFHTLQIADGFQVTITRTGGVRHKPEVVETVGGKPGTRHRLKGGEHVSIKWFDGEHSLLDLKFERT
ncbi:hypothetical protein H7X87_04100 [Acetobacteraceae bacterium]|nr:hypothetical protein [Candidatus Parcubacteria bacterium]